MAGGVYLVTLTVGSAQGAAAILRCGAAVVVGAIVYFGTLVLLRSEDVGGPDPRVSAAGARRRPPAEPLP